MWGCPGGHLEKWETFEDAAKRELCEETGDVVVTEPKLWTVVNTPFRDENKHYVCIFLVADWIKGQPRVMEPEKCEYWGWFKWDELPTRMMPGLKELKGRKLDPWNI
jgi:8-oxo-dGTP diphosphatase